MQLKPHDGEPLKGGVGPSTGGDGMGGLSSCDVQINKEERGWIYKENQTDRVCSRGMFMAYKGAR